MLIDMIVFRQVIEDFLTTNFDLCPVKKENLPLPSDANGKGPKEWLAIFDVPAFNDSLGMGEEATHMGGNLIIQIFVPLNTGTARIRFLAKTLNDLFVDEESFQDITFSPGILSPAPKGEQWYQANLTIPYSVIMGQETYC